MIEPLSRNPDRLTRTFDPDTSHEAGKTFDLQPYKALGAIHFDVIKIALQQPDTRFTDEILDNPSDPSMTEKYSQTTLSKRRTELVEMQIMRDTGLKWVNTGGKNKKKRKVWEIVPQYRSQLTALLGGN